MEKEYEIIENRGAEMKFDFRTMAVGSTHISDRTTGSLLNCAKRQCSLAGIKAKFRCWTNDGKSYIKRVG